MTNSSRIAVDAMGGDEGIAVMLAGVARARRRFEGMEFILVGDEAQIREGLKNHPNLTAASEIVHASDVVASEEKPSAAIRRAKTTSMGIAIDLVKKGQAGAAVSSGNTGALMAMAKFCLRTMANIERPAIAGIWPTLKGESVVLDIGANIGADSQQLLDYALMGGAMARALFEIERPTVGLLNVGVEEVKGLEEVKEAARMLREANLGTIDYAGFVEGDDIGKGTVDVVVTEGFSGNIALKTAEGTARQIAGYLRAAMGRTLMARIGYLFARGAFNTLREKMDVSRANGGVFLGLNGIVVKSHGSADANGFAAAVELGYDMVRNRLLDRIEADLDLFHARNPKAASLQRSGAETEEE